MFSTNLPEKAVFQTLLLRKDISRNIMRRQHCHLKEFHNHVEVEAIWKENKQSTLADFS